MKRDLDEIRRPGHATPTGTGWVNWRRRLLVGEVERTTWKMNTIATLPPQKQSHEAQGDPP
jgi:hypothetical protein